MENEDVKNVSGVATDETQEVTLDDYEQAQKRIAELEKEKETLVIQKNKYKEKLQKQEQVQAPVNAGINERVELRLDGYNAEEVEFILANGGRKALENKFVKSAIDTMREQARSEKAAIDENASGGNVEKQYSRNDLLNLPMDELEKLVPKA